MAHENSIAFATAGPASGMGVSRDPEIDQELLETLQGIGHRWPQRTKDSYTFPGCARFTDDPKYKDPVWLINDLQKHPELWEELERGTTPAHVYDKRHDGKKHRPGRDRVPGHWILIAIAYLLSSKVELEMWYQQNSSNLDLWEAAGFEEVPSEPTFYARMIELEQFVGGIEDAASAAWQMAMSHSPHIGRHWKVDGQAYESHVRLEHDPNCPMCLHEHGDLDRMPRYIDRQSLEVADEIRHQENEQAIEMDDEADLDETDDESAPQDAPEVPILKIDDKSKRLIDIEDTGIDLEDEVAEEIAAAELELAGKKTKASASITDGRKAITIQGHRYLCWDQDAGFKIYQSSSGKKLKQWTGGIALKISDEALGVTISTLHIPADEVEHRHYPELLHNATQIMGTLPENIMGDRGHATRAVKKLNTLLGIGAVIPFRRHGGMKDRSDLAVEGKYNEYGIPLCEHCGSPGTMVGSKELGFRSRDGEPIIIFRCASPVTPECKKTQRIRCSEEWLLFGPLTREEALYFHLSNAGKPSEKNNALDRRRYMLAGSHPDTRAKRLGTSFLDLRASLAAFLDIYRVLLRQGWLESDAKKNPWKISRRTSGERAVASFRRRLRRLGLLLPSGPRAVELGLAFQGELPDGWVPVAERLEQAKKARAMERKKLRRELEKQRADAAKAA